MALLVLPELKERRENNTVCTGSGLSQQGQLREMTSAGPEQPRAKWANSREEGVENESQGFTVWRDFNQLVVFVKGKIWGEYVCSEMADLLLLLLLAPSFFVLRNPVQKYRTCRSKP